MFDTHGYDFFKAVLRYLGESSCKEKRRLNDWFMNLCASVPCTHGPRECGHSHDYNIIPSFNNNDNKPSLLVGGFNPSEKYYVVKLDHFSNRDENHKYFKPPPSLAFFLEMSAILDKLSTSPNLLTFPKVFQRCWLVYYGSFRNDPTTHHASGKCEGSSQNHPAKTPKYVIILPGILVGFG